MLARAQPNRPTRANPAEDVPAGAPPAAAREAPASGDDGVSRSRAVLERVRSVLSAVDRTLRR